MEIQLLPGVTMRLAAPGDAATFAEMHEEVASWLWERGIHQWQPGTFPIKWIQDAIATGELFLACEDGAVIATVILQEADPNTWGAASLADAAGYMHGLRAHLHQRFGAICRRAVREVVRRGMRMRLARFADINEFAARVEPYLLAHEATHCLMLGLLATLPRGPAPADEIPYMALVEDQGAVVLVAMRTPPHNAILSLIALEYAADPSEALRLMAGDLWSRYHDGLPGVHASVPVAHLFAEHWRQQAHVAARLAMRERIYELETVIPVSGVSGSYRRPTVADRDLLVRWLDAFAAEALGPIERLDAADWIDRYFMTPSRGGYLWEDGGAPVSFAAYGNPTPRGIRIGPVYTPPEHRGHGYASACVAALSQRLLESGRAFCYLFTDLANPTSNYIYQKIGYNPVNDVDVYEFETER